MDKLKECLIIFESMLGKDYYLSLENGLTIKVFFARKHFHHLLGLHKLIDIPPLVANKSKNTTTTIYNNIYNDRITYDQICKSAFWSDISERFDYFSNLNTLMFEKVIIDFDKNKVPSAPKYIPLIQAEYILYATDNNSYFHLCLGNSNNLCYPETFIVQHDDYYVTGQIELKVNSLKVVDTTSKGKRKASSITNSKIQSTTSDESAATIENS